MKKLIIAGGTGFLGNVVTDHFKTIAKEIVILTRNPLPKKGNISYLFWDGKTVSNWSKSLEGADVVLNLAGKSVDCRYNTKNRKEILNSRVDSTKVLGQAITLAKRPPTLWINSSTATIYDHSLNKPNDEETGSIGSDFSMDVAKAWEACFFNFALPQTRMVAIRTAIVLGEKGGAFIPLKNLTKMGFGGTQGKGNQMVSWIHEADFAQSIEHIITTKSLEGAVNLTSPNPIRNHQLMKTLRKTCNMPFGMRLNEQLLRCGARIIKTETELLLKSRYVVPSKLVQSGFRFHFDKLEHALKNLCKP